MLHYIYPSGRHVELEPTHAEISVSIRTTGVNIRTPGEPLPRDFTATATIVDDIAYIGLGAAHTRNANPHEVKNAIRTALIEKLGVKDISFRRGKDIAKPD